MKIWGLSLIIFIIYFSPILTAAETSPDYAADLISIQGAVETLPSGTKDWISAQDFQKLYPGDVIRTGELSRAAILFIDHTQIKLNEETVLEIKDIKMGAVTEVSWGRTAKSLFNLVTGEIWVRSGGEVLDLQVDTPVASATVRGTEFVIRADKKKTTVTVVDGAVNLSNEYGEVLINSGEQGIAEEDKPPYKTVIINPEDAVQWALYYPGNISNKDYYSVPLDEMAIIESFFVLYRQKKLAEAINVAKDSLEKQFPNSPRILTILSFGQLLAGQVTNAKENISNALEIVPDYSLAHSILSNIYLVQNNKEKAKEEAELAVKTNPDSPSAHVSLSWVRQSYFDIPGAIEASRRAIELDSENIQAYITLCRLLFGSDKIKEANDIIDKAIQIAPNESTVNATKGFLLLSKGETKESIEYFTKSIPQDSTQGLGHLGLGLAYIRLRNIPEGLREMLIATLLEPKISLYQSYMGKAYFQVAKEYARLGVKKEEAVNYQKYLNLAEKTFLYASYLDPRDPTPYLYSGILFKDLNRPVSAINSLNKSIELNSNRAVYRSKFLLDKDRATENISLAQAYDMLGLSSWGKHLALRSVQSDFSSSGAHLFLAHAFRGVTKAATSEVIQSNILMPVNENTFNTYNNYTSLFETPEFHSTLFSNFGEDELRTYAGKLYGGSGRYASMQVLSYYKDSGYLPSNNDYESIWNYTYFKYSLGMRSHIYIKSQTFLQDYGSSAPTWSPFQNDPDFRTAGKLYELCLGYYYQINPDTHILLFTKGKEDGYRFKDEYLTEELLSAKDRAKDITRLWDGQIEVIQRYGNHQFIYGFDHYDGRLTYDAETKIPPLEIDYPSIKVPQRYSKFIIRDYWKLNEFLEFDLALRYDILDNGDINYNDTLHVRELNPQAGILISPFTGGTFRAAVMRNTNTYFEESLFPTNTAGFIIDHNEEIGSQNTEYNIAWDQIIGDKTFFTISGTYRDRELPTLADITLDDRFVGGNFILNRILNKYTALSAEYSYLKSDDQLGERSDQQVKLHLGFVHHKGWFAELTETYMFQENEELTVKAPFDTDFWTTDASLGYEFPKKRGKLTLSVENLFDNEFEYVKDPYASGEKLPVRRATLKAEIYF